MHDAITPDELENELDAIAARLASIAKALSALEQRCEQWLPVPPGIPARERKRLSARDYVIPPNAERPRPTEPARYLRTEGDTANQVRILYDKPDGVMNVEAARRLQLAPKKTRRNFERLIKQGLAVRMGHVYALNAQGREAWESSPLVRD